MPIYEYLCKECDQKFEVIQKFSDEPLSRHEGCGGEVERLISSSALHFKGSGWYVTDYAKKNGSSPNHRADSGSKSEDKAEAKSEAKSESKSETKSEAKPAATTSSSTSDSK